MGSRRWAARSIDGEQLGRIEQHAVDIRADLQPLEPEAIHAAVEFAQGLGRRGEGQGRYAEKPVRIALHDLRQAIVSQACQPQLFLRLEPADHGKTQGEHLQVDAVPIQHPEPLLHVPQDVDVGRALRLYEGTDGERVQAPPFGPQRD